MRSAARRPCRPQYKMTHRSGRAGRLRNYLAQRPSDFPCPFIRNHNTRAAYARAVKQFFDWTDKRRLELHEIEAITVAAYIELLGTTVSRPTVKQHLAAIRRLFDYLTTGGFSPPIRRVPFGGPNPW